jgi:hypothetical protein
MKFKNGDSTDTQLCAALHHEFLRCHDAFLEFQTYASHSVMAGENRWLAYKGYNAYSRFIHHLYEFMAGALVRDIKNTKIDRNNLEAARKTERYIMGHTQRILTNRRNAIENGTVPEWENTLCAYAEKVPSDFAKHFREYRNTVSGHVKYERALLSLSDFYDRYHQYMHMLYRDAYDWWGLRGKDFPDLKEITDFSIMIGKTKGTVGHNTDEA